MNRDPVGGAVWYVETHLGCELSLAAIADFVKVSRFHLLRAFGASTGRSVMSYVRARRLTESARQLAAGAADILGVAVGAGYASHEAFTRAFRWADAGCSAGSRAYRQHQTRGAYRHD